jgi:hypothetical protein
VTPAQSQRLFDAATGRRVATGNSGSAGMSGASGESDA